MKWLKSLSKRQRIGLVGVMLLVLLGIFVPYRHDNTYVGYALIMRPAYPYFRVDVVRVAIPMFVVICATVAGILLTNDSPTKEVPDQNVNDSEFRERFRR